MRNNLEVYSNPICYFKQVLQRESLPNPSISLSRLHQSSCSVIGSVTDRRVLMNNPEVYFNSVCYFEQVLQRESFPNLSVSLLRLHPSSCSLIGSVKDRKVLMNILEVYFKSMLFLSSFVKRVFSKTFVLLVKTAPILLLCNWICEGQEGLDEQF